MLLDIDECNENLSNCDVNAECENFQGTYKCKCKEGYQSITSNRTAYEGECVGKHKPESCLLEN